MTAPPNYPFPLCQPDPGKSCGACCGLYNWQDHRREALVDLLRKRTSLFLTWKPDLEAYRERARSLPSSPKLFEDIYNCEFLGFLDPEERRVGCLLHPSLHGGRDFRDRSFYGEGLCAGHFCPSYTHLTNVEQAAVIRSLDDWYLYGLVVTDIDLVKEFLRQAQDRMGDRIRELHFEDAQVREAFRAFLVLKESWKFASKESRLGKYCFSHAEYRIARIEYERNWNMRPSRFDRILVSLGSEFGSPEEVLEAESVIEERIEEFLEACRGTPCP